MIKPMWRYKVTAFILTLSSKRYIKYLTKKFLKKQQLKDYLQVISSSKTGYLVKYYDINQGADEEAADE